MSNLQNDKLNATLQHTLPGAIHYNFAFPWDEPTPHFISGKGHVLTDADGEQHYDFFSKFGAAILGHGHQQYAAALATALQNLTAVDHFGAPEVTIIERLLAAVPDAEQVRFSLSGTEAVLNALRIARAYTGKQKIIRFAGHYHGSADPLLGGVADGSGHSYQAIPLKGDPRGTAGRASGAFDDMLILPWNDQKAIQEALEEHKDNIAAIIMEPVCINGGGLWASKEYFTYLRSAADQHKTLIIFDEVITGFRLQYGSAQSLTGIRPDIWIFGKAIAGGSLPVSCIMSSRSIMRVLTDKKVTHGGTFNGYNLGLYAIDATLNVLENSQAYARATEQSKRLQSAILQAAHKHNVSLVSQGHPMAICLHACKNEITNASQWTNEIKAKETIIRDAFRQERIFIAPPCRLYPNIAIDETAVDRCMAKLDSVFAQVRKAYDAADYEE